MDHVPVESKLITSYGYDPGARVLEVEFKNGKRYRYAAVPQHVADGLASAESKGKFILANVKGHFEHMRTDAPEDGVL